MSDYFDASSNRITPGTTARALDVNQLRDDTGAAFDALPLLGSVTYDTVTYADTVGGTANAIELTMELTATSYPDGYYVAWKASANNTGAVTVNVDSLGSKSLVTADGAALVADDLVQNYIYAARYNSTSDKFELQRLLSKTLSNKVDYAEEWANKAEDSLVSTAAGGDGVDDYSALHWARKAEDYAASALVWTYKTTAINYTASSAEHIVVTAAGKTITLPASPSEGNTVRISVGDFEDTLIGRNGSTIWGIADDRTINQANATVTLVYVNSDWEVY